MAINVGWDEEEDIIKLSTIVQNNEYYTVAFTYNEPESEEDEGSVSYVITGHTVGDGVEFVPININATSISQRILEKLVDFDNNTLRPNFIVLTTKGEADTYPILMPSDAIQSVYRSAVMDGKYYQLVLSIKEAGADVNIEQIPVGGQSTINLAVVDTLTQDQFLAIKDKGVRVTYDDIDLLLSKWDEENDYPILTSAVCDNKYLQIKFTENEMGEADTEPTYSYVVEEILAENSILVLNLDNYVEDPRVLPKPGQWNNVTASNAMGQGKLVFITSGRYRVWLISMIEFPGEDVSSYTVAIQGAVTSDHSVVGIGWDDNNQMFYFNSGPK